MDVSDLGSIDFNQVDCFSSVIGSHQVTYNLNGAGTQCSNDVTSTANITQSEIVIDSCYSGTDDSKKSVLFSFYFHIVMLPPYMPILTQEHVHPQRGQVTQLSQLLASSGCFVAQGYLCGTPRRCAVPQILIQPLLTTDLPTELLC